MNIFSQEDSLRNQILDYKDSSYEILSKGRRMLIDEFNKSDMLKVMDIKDLLLKENNGNVYETFYPIEYIYILYWTEEHNALIDFIKQVDYQAPISYSVRTLAQTDNLFQTLLQKTLENKDVVQMFIRDSQISDMDKEFLLLQLDDILRLSTSNKGLDTNSDETKHINDMSDAFLEKYPDSPYETIIRETIRFKFEPSPWAFYWDIFGLGPTFVTGNLSKSFDTGIGLGMAFDLRYKKFVSILGFDISIHEHKNDMNINGATWYKEDKGDLGAGYLNVGYLLLDNKKFSIYPYVGYAYTGISISDPEVTKNTPELNKLGLNCWAPQFGIGFDFKFNIFDPYSYGLFNGSRDGNSRISFRYTIRKADYTKIGANIPAMDGFTHNIAISWGIGGRKTKRIK
jgi:opacity protein-like surface antigen